MSVILLDIPSRGNITSRLGSKPSSISERLGGKPKPQKSSTYRSPPSDQKREPKNSNKSLEALNNEIDKYKAGMEETPAVESRKIISYDQINPERDL